MRVGIGEHRLDDVVAEQPARAGRGRAQRVGQPLDDSLDALLAELERRRDRPPQALADEVTTAMLDGVEAKDDVCLVAARWTGAR